MVRTYCRSIRVLRGHTSKLNIRRKQAPDGFPEDRDVVTAGIHYDRRSGSIVTVRAGTVEMHHHAINLDKFSRQLDLALQLVLRVCPDSCYSHHQNNGNGCRRPNKPFRPMPSRTPYRVIQMFILLMRRKLTPLTYR